MFTSIYNYVGKVFCISRHEFVGVLFMRCLSFGVVYFWKDFIFKRTFSRLLCLP